jgi:hypothetical protein
MICFDVLLSLYAACLMHSEQERQRELQLAQEQHLAARAEER